MENDDLGPVTIVEEDKTQLATQKSNLVDNNISLVISKEKLINYLDTIGVTNKLSNSQKEQFIEIAQCFKLNPFKREIHAVVYSGKDGKQTLSVITGYEVYIKRAERSGKLDGWKAWIKKDGESLESLIGCIEIYRKDWNRPFYHEVYFSEVANKNGYGKYTSFWLKAPKFQLKKVAISQGFRLCFPDELAGIPYTSDELPDEMTERNVTPYNDNYKDEIAKAEACTTLEQLRELYNEFKTKYKGKDASYLKSVVVGVSERIKSNENN